MSVTGRSCKPGHWTSFAPPCRTNLPVLPHFWCSSCPEDQGKALRGLSFVDLTRRPDREPTAGEEPARNLLPLQRDHSSRTASPAPKVRENLKATRSSGQKLSSAAKPRPVRVMSREVPSSSVRASSQTAMN